MSFPHYVMSRFFTKCKMCTFKINYLQIIAKKSQLECLQREVKHFESNEGNTECFWAKSDEMVWWCCLYCFCVSATTTPSTTETHLVTMFGPCSSLVMGLDSSTLLVYSLLAMSLLLLLLSLSLALVVFLRGDRVKTLEPRPQEAINTKVSVIQHVQEDGQPPQISKGQSVWEGINRTCCNTELLPRWRPSIHQWLSLTLHQFMRTTESCGSDRWSEERIKFVSSSPTETAVSYSCATEQEPSDDSIPTETCVCIHCFPDLKSVGHSGERPYVLYPNLVAYKPPAQNGTAHQTEVNFAANIQEHAAVR